VKAIKAEQPSGKVDAQAAEDRKRRPVARTRRFP
jgi:hypothetical protein